MPDSNVAPKVFISYSWSTPKHQQQVIQWAERLVSDGVEVILDVFDLKEGHDKFHFMEQMIVNPAVTHVLVLSDRQYVEKANRRVSGVGTESQIISSEIYGRVSQSKFVPIVCEFSESNDPYLPAFMQALIWIDFSSAEMVNQNWERLVRHLYGKPAYVKPSLGSPPAYLSETPTTSASPLLGKLATLRQALTSKSRTTSLARQDSVAECVSFAEPYRSEQTSPTKAEALAEKLLGDVGELKTLRNAIVDWVLFESSLGEGTGFTETLLEFLEHLLEMGSRPAYIQAGSDAWFEGIRFFAYETFLYIVAALLKNASYDLLGDVLSSSYLKPRTARYEKSEFGRVDLFLDCSDFFQSVLAAKNMRLYSPTAELLKRQSDRSDLPLTSLIEADLIVFLKAITSQDFRWYPQTLFYASNSEFPFLIRAAQRRNFKNLATVIGVQDSETMKARAREGYNQLAQRMGELYMAPRSPWESLRVDAYDSV